MVIKFLLVFLIIRRNSKLQVCFPSRKGTNRESLTFRRILSLSLQFLAQIFVIYLTEPIFEQTHGKNISTANLKQKKIFNSKFTNYEF